MTQAVLRTIPIERTITDILVDVDLAQKALEQAIVHGESHEVIRERHQRFLELLAEKKEARLI